MRKIKLYWVGKTKSEFIRIGINEYLKFLKGYANIEVNEIKESSGLKTEVIKEESQRILEKINENFILLDEAGKEFSSVEFSNFIKDTQNLNFVIGGVFGVSKELKDRAFFKLSLSKMTFTHEMTRLIFLEQLYRAFTIISGKKYHY